MSLDVSNLFAQALACYQAGQLSEADRICRDLLREQPRLVAGWNLLGVVAFSATHYEASLIFFGNAVSLASDESDYHSNLGMAYQAVGRFADAMACYRRAVELRPESPTAHDNLGNCFYALARYDEALQSHQQALAIDRNVAAVHNNLGNCSLVLGRIADAVNYFRRAIELKPNFSAAHNNLGTALLRQGSLAEAELSFQRAIEFEPGMAEAYTNSAAVAERRGDLERAVTLFERSLALRPGDGAVLAALGNVLSALGRSAEAVDRLREAAERAPNSAAVFNHLGNALRVGDRLDEAFACFEKSLALNPLSASTHANLAATWHTRGAVDEAIQCYRRALALDPRYCFAHTGLAQALAAVGQADASREHLRQAIEIEPENALAHWALATSTPRPLPTATARNLERLLQDTSRREEDRCLLHFALADSYDKSGDYDHALEHAHRANKLRRTSLQRRGCGFDRAAHAAQIDATIAFYTREFFAAAESIGTKTELPIFVVGMPRSGTTLVEQILAGHPQVYGAGELDVIHSLRPEVRQLLAAGKERGLQWTAAETARLQALGRTHLESLERLGGSAVRVVDKMPTNFLYLGMISALFPQARVIHCVRDPRDVLLSCYFQNFSSEAMNFTFDWDDLTAFWEDYRRLMDHWRMVLPRPIYELSYESLVAAQEVESRALVAQCGLAWDRSCLEFYKSKRPVWTASAIQVREPIYNQSVARWKHYEPHFDALPLVSLPAQTSVQMPI